MLGERVNTHNDMRTPTFEKFCYIGNASFVKELARFRSDPVHAPIKVLHPVLPVSQNPIVQLNQTRGEMVRLFNRFHHSNRIRLTFKKFLHPSNNCGGGGTVPSTGVRRDDEDLGCAFGRECHFLLAPWCLNFVTWSN